MATDSRPRVIGALTIGQAPRDDVVPDIRSTLGRGFEILEIGALDGLTEEEIREQSGRFGGAVLVTRLRDGHEAQVREHFLVPRLRDALRRLEARTELILFLCTADFPSLEASRPVLSPGPLLRHVVRALNVKRLGVLTPARVQVEPQGERWRGFAHQVFVEHASPYGAPQELATAARRLGELNVDLVAMDCIGYTLAMKQAVRSRLDRPVLLASTLLAKVAAEHLE